MPDSSLQVKFTADISELASGVRSAQSEIKGFVDSIGSVTNALPAIGESIAAAFAVDKIVAFAAEFADMGSVVEHATHQLGLPAEEISALNAGFATMGLGADQGARALEHLERSAAEAAVGPNASSRAFRALGVSVMDASGHLKSAGTLLHEIADAYARSADGPGKTAAGMQLLGRGAAEMTAMLNKGSAGLNDFQRIAVETGTLISGSMAKAMDETSTKMSTATLAVKGLGIAIFNDLQPYIDKAAEGLARFAEKLTAAFSSSEHLKNIEAIRSEIAATEGELKQVQALTPEGMAQASARSAQMASEQMQRARDRMRGTPLEMGDGASVIPTGPIETASQKVAELTEKLVALQKALQAEEKAAAASDTTPDGKKQITLPPGQSSSAADQMRSITDAMHQQIALTQSGTQVNDAYYARLGQDARLAAASIRGNSSASTAAAATEYQSLVTLENEKFGLYQKDLAAKTEALKEGLAAYQAILDTDKNLSAEQTRQLKSNIDRTTTEYQQSLAEQKIAAENHNAELDRLGEQYLSQQNKNISAMAKLWEQAFGQIENAASTFTSDIIERHQTAAQAGIDAAKRLTTEWIEDLAKVTLELAAFKTASAVFGSGSSITGAIGKSLGSSALGSLVSGAGGSNSQSGADQQLITAITGQTTATQQNTGGIFGWIGQAIESVATWITGTAATTAQTAATTASTGGLIGAIGTLVSALATNDGTMIGLAEVILASKAIPAYATGAWNIPTTQIALLHPGEMVIPAGPAAAMRRGGAPVDLERLGTSAAAFASGSSGSANGVSGGSPTLNLNVGGVNALNAQSVVALFNNPSILRQVARNISGYMANNPSTRGAY